MVLNEQVTDSNPAYGVVFNEEVTDSNPAYGVVFNEEVNNTTYYEINNENLSNDIDHDYI